MKRSPRRNYALASIALVSIGAAIGFALSRTIPASAPSLSTAQAGSSSTVLGQPHVPGNLNKNAGPTKAQPNRPEPQDCTGKTIMNVVAHEDDDLLFLNPTIIHSLSRGDCVRTVFLTAGDDGRGIKYLTLREAGSQAAYSKMLGYHKSMPWSRTPLQITTTATAQVASPVHDSAISLIFLRLPDGNLDGSGFKATGRQSLAKLYAGKIPSIASVDTTSTYNTVDLINGVASLMQQYQPTEILTQANDSNSLVTDHSDHIATGELTTVAAQVYAIKSKLGAPKLVRYFKGYPIRALPSNLSSTDVEAKSAAFFAYAANDQGVCTSRVECDTSASTYGSYISREYTQ